MRSGYEMWKLKKSFSKEARLEFYRQVVALRDAGMTFRQILQQIHTVASNEGSEPDNDLAQITLDMLMVERNGEGFAAAMEPWVPSEDLMMIRATASSPRFAQDFSTYLRMVELRGEMARSIKGGLQQPIMLVTMVTGLVYYFGTFVIPALSPLYPVEKWTGLALFLKGLVTFTEHYMVPLIIILLTALGAIWYSLPRWTGAGRAKADKFPIYSIYRTTTGLGFLVSLASLLQTGMQGVDAVNRLRPTASRYAGTHLAAIRYELKNGVPLGEALHSAGTNWPGEKLNLSIKTFSKARDLSGQMTRLAVTWVEEANIEIAKRMDLFKNVCLALVAGTVMGILLGFFDLIGQMTAGM